MTLRVRFLYVVSHIFLFDFFNNVRSRIGLTALVEACKNGNIDIVTTLIEAGAHVQARNNYGHTPLGLARIYHHNDIVSLLSASGDKNE